MQKTERQNNPGVSFPFPAPERGRLFTIDGETLMNSPMQPIRFVIQTLLPQGLSILAGAPKTGKSWLVLQICLAVAKGESLWGLPTTKSAVLYLCLEDSFTRIQSRLFDVGGEAPDNVFFAVLSDAIGAGLEAQIENFLSERPCASLIVIDTLQKVRSLTSDNAYRTRHFPAHLSTREMNVWRCGLWNVGTAARQPTRRPGRLSREKRTIDCALSPGSPIRISERYKNRLQSLRLSLNSLRESGFIGFSNTGMMTSCF